MVNYFLQIFPVFGFSSTRFFVLGYGGYGTDYSGYGYGGMAATQQGLLQFILFRKL